MDSTNAMFHAMKLLDLVKMLTQQRVEHLENQAADLRHEVFVYRNALAKAVDKETLRDLDTRAREGAPPPINFNDLLEIGDS